MKLACTQENLQKGLLIVGRMVSKNSTLPVLGNVLLKTEKGGLRLTATDLEVGVSCVVGGKIDEKGEITIPARLLSEYVSQLPKERVALKTSNQELTVACEDSTATIKGISAEEFPLVPTVEGTIEITVPAAAFREAVEQVAFAAARDESRPELAGIYFHLEKGVCTLAATDSFRLAEKKISYKGPAGPHVVIIPTRTIMEIGRVLDSSGELTIRLSDNQVLFVFDNVELVSRLIEGQYPPYRDVIPQQLGTKATVNRMEFLQAVRTAGLFSKTAAQDVKITVDPAKKHLLIQAEASQVGGHHQTVPAKIEGELDTVIFNFRYLTEGLQALTKDEVVFETGGSSSPGKLTNAGTKETNYLYIVMPIKL